MFEDINVIIRNRNSKKDGQYNDQKKKKHNWIQISSNKALLNNWAHMNSYAFNTLHLFYS